MKSRFPLSCLAIAAALVARAGTAAAVEIKNDGFSNGATVSYQGGFAAGEVAAARLTPPAGMHLLAGVRFLFGGATTTEDITLIIWDDSAGTVVPGAELFRGDYSITGQNDARQEIDLLAESLIIAGPIRVGIQITHEMRHPGPAVDQDGNTTPDVNFILAGASFLDDASAGTWMPTSAFGLTGDWIIRAELQPIGGAPDASVRDAARGDASSDASADAGKKDDDGGGCGCKTGARDDMPLSAPVAAGVLFLLAALAMSRRP